MAEITSPAAMDLTDEDKQEPSMAGPAVTQAMETALASETTATTAAVSTVIATTIVTDEQWRAMKKVIEALYAHRDSE